MATDVLKLFLVRGEAWNGYFRDMVPIESFVAASSSDQAKQTALRKLHEQRDENRRRAEELKQREEDGEIDLDRPDLRTSLSILNVANTLHPRNEKKWSATEVTLPGYEIHLVAKP
ncbi:MAG: hypothetical protein A2940_00535 [Candidatus Wildermuthbacteria bacterium RIFCSPLOWO2_01_FULL_48_29]|uniref:Uncharacterized protein n=2 Tax=Parcubacteria group TaxID=1794811 RepID=A0A1G2RJT5_9BACT|nr:MAG: hypothetical protein A2669_00550 [Candidatus Yanofskybacteria bacterium RIFCSPHIGHO2_01_FULL_48_25b]OHA73115.1 MAG: hypothetical protein A2940_00535 [Candidatus Wildermuthbacteria bacterium RIFCSPLOWO2_01_FULL_48_29]